MSDALSSLGAQRVPGPTSADAPPVAPAPPDDFTEAEAVEANDGHPEESQADKLARLVRSRNIAEEMGDEERDRVAQTVLREFEIDNESCGEYLDRYERWLDFALQKSEPKTYPWPGASNVVYPLITTAAFSFGARAYPAIIRDSAVAKGKVVGPDPDGQKADRAARVGQHMSWQLLEEQEEWEPQTDRMLVTLPVVGTMFRKSYFDPGLGRNVSETVDANRLIVKYDAKSFETAPRHSELIPLYPVEIDEKVRAGLFLAEDYGTDPQAAEDADAPVTFIEQHRRLDLDDDGYPEPYIVTVAKDSGRLARIVAAFEMEGITWGPDGDVRRIERVQYYTKYGFFPNPESKVYDLGFGQLLWPINESINSSLNQMFDAGHLANAGGGFIGSGLSLNTGAVRFQVGEYKPVNVVGGTIRDNVMPLPFGGPPPVLLQLVQFLVEAGERAAAVKDIMSGDLPNQNTPATTTLAVMEQGLQVYSAIYKRIYRALKNELQKLFRLNAKYLDDDASYRRGDEWRSVSRVDYAEGAGVEPISDPRMLTDMQRLGRAQFLMGFANDPWFNGQELRKRILEAAQIDHPEKVLLTQPMPNPIVGMRDKELSIRAAREAADLHLRGAHFKAEEVRELAQAVLYLAQAKKADADADTAWMDRHLRALEMQLDNLTGAGPGSPAAVPQGVGSGGPDSPGGLPAMAAPSGNGAGVGIPGGQ